MKNTKKEENLRTKIIPFNSWDYSYFIRDKKKNFQCIKNTVFIDDGSPKF